METIVKKLYEAMFLIDSAEAASDWDGVNAAISKILERADAENVSMRKWDDRKLEYEIKGKERGTYILCYFNCGGDKVGGIERDVQLSEKIMRVLILSADKIPVDYIEKETPAELTEKQEQEQPEESTEEKTDTIEEASLEEAVVEETPVEEAVAEEVVEEEVVEEEVPVEEAVEKESPEEAVVEEAPVEKDALAEEVAETPVEESSEEEAAESEDK